MMLKLTIDTAALVNAIGKGCMKCGSERIVSTVSFNVPDPPPRCLNGLPITYWVCKPCYDTLLEHAFKPEVMFEREGFLDENLTIYDMQELAEKRDEFDEQFEKTDCRTRFKLWQEASHHYQMIIHGDEFQKVAAVREAEAAMRELCEGRMRFVKRYVSDDWTRGLLRCDPVVAGVQCRDRVRCPATPRRSSAGTI